MQIQIDYNPSSSDHYFISVPLNDKEAISFDKTIKGHHIVKQVFKEKKIMPKDSELDAEWDTLVIDNGKFERKFHVRWIDKDKLDWLNDEVWETVWEKPIPQDINDELLRYSRLVSDNYEDLGRYFREMEEFEKLLQGVISKL
jgi:hypothetical protein